MSNSSDQCHPAHKADANGNNKGNLRVQVTGGDCSEEEGRGLRDLGDSPEPSSPREWELGNRVQRVLTFESARQTPAGTTPGSPGLGRHSGPPGDSHYREMESPVSEGRSGSHIY